MVKAWSRGSAKHVEGTGLHGDHQDAVYERVLHSVPQAPNPVRIGHERLSNPAINFPLLQACVRMALHPNMGGFFE